MKVYVRGYGPKKLEKEKEDDQDPVRPPETLVEYSPSPEWKMPSYIAEPELQILRRMGVHVGAHYCEFSIEELPESECAIVCLEHPELISR